MNTEYFCKIRIAVDRSESRALLALLKEMRIGYAYMETARSVLLDARTTLRSVLRNSTAIREKQTAIVAFIVPEGHARDCLNYLTWRLDIDAPGKGSITAKRLERLAAAGGLEAGAPAVGAYEPRIVTEGLTGLCCITVKGAGNDVAMVGLTTGTAVPDIAYGMGTGLRNRLGAWRILIPAEKEVTNLVVRADEAPSIMELMIAAGRLDEPGKGFIFEYPLELGVLETRFSVGETRHAASMEQLIYAMDELKGSTDWRRKGPASSGPAGEGLKYLTGLVDLTLICNEGYCEQLTREAMDAGAGGATMRRLKYLPLASEARDVSPARETSVMTIPLSMVERVSEAIVCHGLLEPAVSGELVMNPVTRALTYLGK